MTIQHGLKPAKPKTTASVIAAAAIFFTVLIARFIRLPPVCCLMQCDVECCNSFATLSYHIRNSCVTRVSQNHTDVKRFRGCFEEKIQIFLKNPALLSQLKRNKQSENVTVVLRFSSKSAECNRHRTLFGTFWCAPVCIL